MTDFTANSEASYHPSNLIAGIASFFSGITAGYQSYLTFSNLDRLSDAQLTDLGLTRSDLPRAAAAPLFDR